MDLLSKAIIFATNAHDSMRRKQSSLPYIVHPLEAMAVAATMTDDQTVLAAAALHDVVEDTPITIDEIEDNFGEQIAYLVGAETEDKREYMDASDSWDLRKEEALRQLVDTDDIRVKIIFLSDKLANMRAFYEQYNQMGERMWECFNQKDPHKQYRYYKTISDATKELSNYRAWKEYDSLVRIVFEKECAFYE